MLLNFLISTFYDYRRFEGASFGNRKAICYLSHIFVRKEDTPIVQGNGQWKNHVMGIRIVHSMWLL